MKEVDIMSSLKEERKTADFAFYRAVELKDQFLIAHAISKLNEIDMDILKEEYRQQNVKRSLLEQQMEKELCVASISDSRGRRRFNEMKFLSDRARRHLEENMTKIDTVRPKEKK